jgi:hypothetical protein
MILEEQQEMQEEEQADEGESFHIPLRVSWLLVKVIMHMLCGYEFIVLRSHDLYFSFLQTQARILLYVRKPLTKRCLSRRKMLR